MFSVHITPENFKTQQTRIILDLCLRKIRSAKFPDHRDVIVFQKVCFQNVLVDIYQNEKPVFSNSSGLKRVFEKLRFGDGLVCTVVNKAAFSNSLAWFGRNISFCRTTIKKTRTTAIATETCLQRLLLN